MNNILLLSKFVTSDKVKCYKLLFISGNMCGQFEDIHRRYRNRLQQSMTLGDMLTNNCPLYPSGHNKQLHKGIYSHSIFHPVHHQDICWEYLLISYCTYWTHLYTSYWNYFIWHAGDIDLCVWQQNYLSL